MRREKGRMPTHREAKHRKRQQQQSNLFLGIEKIFRIFLVYAYSRLFEIKFCDRIFRTNPTFTFYYSGDSTLIDILT